ncbi:MAG: hypothetical protein FJ276_11405 [Planctomycetes bacterium]|nr:hypothetical protein [Planctomycetota bacterium]
MMNLVQRAAMPTLLFAAGIVSLVYGAKHHVQQVFEEQEVEIAIDLPGFGPPAGVFPGTDGMPPGLPGMDGLPGIDGPPGFPGLPGMEAFGPPPAELQKIKQKVMVPLMEPEWVLVRDVTIGGLALIESGGLRRTYSGEPPSLCPT